MRKAHKTNYAVNAKNTSFIMIKEIDKVSDVLRKIQNKEGDDSYKYIFYGGAQMVDDDTFFDYYEPATVYIVSKTSEIPKELDIWTTTTLTSKSEEEDSPSIDGADVLDFEIPEPADMIPDIIDDDDDDDEPKPAPTRKAVKGSKKQYRVFTTLTFNSMLKGHLIDDIQEEMTVKEVKNSILNFVKKDESLQDIIGGQKLEIHLFLPCGAPFLSGTIKEWNYCFDLELNRTLYAIFTRKLGDSSSKIYKQVCDCHNDEMKLLLSPFCDSTIEGYTQISSLLGYFYYGGSLPLAENLLRNLATMTGFAPMINSIYTIMIQKKVTGLMIASITSALQTFISEKVKGSNLKTAFSYTISLMSYINCTKIKNLPIPNLILYSYKDEEDDDKEKDPTQIYLKKNLNTNFIILWDKDLAEVKFDVIKRSTQVDVKKLNESFKSEMSLKPVSPMTISYLSSVSFIRMQKNKKDSIVKVGLFIRKKPEKDKKRNVLFIDPENIDDDGNPEEVDYEDLADRFEDDTIDESKSDTSLQQIIFVCLDTSISMKNQLNGMAKKAKNKQPSRKELAIKFLKSLMKKIHDYMIPTARGLILFGKKIEIKCPLSIAERNFNEAVEKVNSYGNTPLWSAIDLAADEIIKFNPYEIVDDEKKFKYPQARGRIILLSDADDTQNVAPDDIYNITKKLVDNDIVMDVIMISSIEECRDALVSSKITGGLSFRPENEEEGIQLFEKETFIDINTRSDLIPYDGVINDKSFMEINRSLGRDPYVKEIQNKEVKKCNVKAELSSVIYTLFYRKDEKYQPKSICERYIMKQLNRIKKKEDPEIVVYTFQKDLKKWRVFIKGPDKTPYENAWWNLFVSFPSNYPNSPPNFRFISVPYHPNVSSEGLLLFKDIADAYDPAHKMPSILKNIQKLLKKPDPVYVLHDSIEKERIEDNDVFVRKAKASKTARAKDDYHEFIAGTKINEEIPEDGWIDDGDDAMKDLFVSITDAVRAKRIGDSDEEDVEGIDE